MLERARAHTILIAAACALLSCTGDIGQPGGAGACVGEICSGSVSTTRSCVDDGSCATGTTVSETGAVGAGNPLSTHGIGASTRLVKLSNTQWENSVRDLLQLSAPTGLSQNLAAAPEDRGYDTQAAAEQVIGSDSVSRYETAANELATRLRTDAALLARVAPEASAGARRDTFIKSFGRRAYRRPLSAEEVTGYTALFDTGANGAAFADGAALVATAMLQSPFFLYRVERSEPKPGTAMAFLDGYEMASRLSYALWHTTPSNALLDAAGAGELDTAEGVERWARTLLDDPRAVPVLVSFLAQTFEVSRYGSQSKAASLGFDAAALAPTLQSEASTFFEKEVLGAKAGIATLLTSSAVYVNADTAPYYGLSGVTGSALVRRELPVDERAGLFTQLGFLTKNATSTGSDPVHRGLIILRKVLCDEPDPPPMMFSLPTPTPGLSTREVYEKATACGVGCHDKLINPPGFAFEGFDTLGRIRREDAGKAVDASATLTIREGFDRDTKAAQPAMPLAVKGAVDMLKQLASVTRVHECYARNLMRFTLGREVSEFERGVGQSLGKLSRDAGDTRALIAALMAMDTARARVDAEP
jgi:hypothetical protein